MNNTTIEWCARPGTLPKTWNPIRARIKGNGGLRSGTFCTRISPGCTNCYASVINKRFGNGLEYTVPNLENVEFFLLQQPLKTKTPCTIFCGDMFDLFHEAINFGLIGDVLATICEAKQHTFQLLTKRAARMKECFEWMQIYSPIPNVWLGVSVESQKYADERIPLLLQTPASIRFLSVEPQLEAVDLTRYFRCNCEVAPKNDQFAPPWSHGETCPYRARIHQVIVGGESSPHARPFNLAWAESLQDQCKSAGVSFFMKQIGSNSFWPCSKREDGISGTIFPKPKDRKGGDPSEWPESLRVREFPA
jgi:protein gp37